MEAIELLKKYKTSKIKKLINKNKINIELEELLMSCISYNRNDLVYYLINNKQIDLYYIDNLEYDFISMAVSSGNIEAIDLLIKKGMNVSKKYKYGKKIVPVTYYVKDLDTLKYLENYIDKKEIKKAIESIIQSTIMNYDIWLLDYIIDTYKINLKRIKYEIQGKKYNILELTEEILQSMKNREYRKREMTIYVCEIFKDRKHKKIRKRAYDIINDIEIENNEIEEYYKYVKQKFGVKR